MILAVLAVRVPTAVRDVISNLNLGICNPKMFDGLAVVGISLYLFNPALHTGLRRGAQVFIV
jgi:hypothetical protein